MPQTATHHVTIIGGGPTGLMAAEVLSQAGVRVDLYDGMPSVGRKFLLAGVGGMNITTPRLTRPSSRATPSARRRWRRCCVGLVPKRCANGYMGWVSRPLSAPPAECLPTDMKAAPPPARLARSACVTKGAWLCHTRHRWTGWNTEGDFTYPQP